MLLMMLLGLHCTLILMSLPLYSFDVGVYTQKIRQHLCRG